MTACPLLALSGHPELHSTCRFLGESGRNLCERGHQKMSGTFSMSIFQVDRLMPRDIDWIDDLAPDEAQAALANLDTNKGPFSVREVVELRRLRNAERGTKIK